MRTGEAIIDPVALLVDLIRRPSVTPEDAGALDLVETALAALGFACERLVFGEGAEPAIQNLFASIGTGHPHFCFAGHTDVVPPGDPATWSVDPFAGVVAGGAVIGRGACDMKGAIACFVAALADFLEARDGRPGGTISLLITGDEEGPAINGTVKVLAQLAASGRLPDLALVGEPTNPTRLGQMMKIGRRGSLNGRLVVAGAQGHVAYPERADNPVPRLLDLLTALRPPLDHGHPGFQPSNLEITSIDVGNPTHNVIPARAEARFNIRFNPRWTGFTLAQELRRRLDAVGTAYALETVCSGEAFLTERGPLSDAVAAAVRDVTGLTPEASTSGGTSDARFIAAHCPVVEFGLVGASMHKVDERASLADIADLRRIYRGVLDRVMAP